ncbi:carboxypeptidase-like regulatory domain-containing protein [Aureivirga sp. CE67]|uniref:carboxypeptidase-like regulatory domain-containing protein n=1 Tax=Aureivirga sp. CE67 TaxID=1788983 RepID=UPI0018CA9A67|nr:carboxypeptidase-like regulatory domain-containing protein [Aureivirga sp. CE67]
MQKIKISIPQPCSEKFKNFTQTEKGGFCQSCQTEVIDFTKMSKEEIITFFQNKSSKNTCGRFRKEDLDFVLTETKKVKPKKYNLLGAASIIGLSFLSFFTSGTTFAQGKPYYIEENKQATPKKKTKNEKKYSVTGTTYDDTGIFPGVDIFLKGSNIGTSSDINGKFIFPEKLKENDILVFSFMGYEEKEVIIKKNKREDIIILDIILEDTSHALGEYEVIVEKPNLFQRFLNLFRKKDA